MKICHVTEYCHAAGHGGTERYVLELVRALDKAGMQNSIGWLCAEKDLRPFTLDGARIIPVCSMGSRIDPLERMFEANAARAIFHDEQPDILHFHTFGRAEAAVARLAVEQGVPYVFTYHTPALSCRRDTLLRWGRIPCDGEVRTLRCAACKLQERLNVAPWLACVGMLLSALPGYFLGRLASGKLRRRSAFVSDTDHFRTELREFLSQASIVVTCCDWSTPLLVANGVPPERIFHCPQGASMDFVEASVKRGDRPPTDDGTFVVGYVGRLSPIKGIHILVEAFTRTTYPAARLRIHGWSPNDSVRQYTHEVLRRASRDSRISFLPKLPFERMVDEYCSLSLLAIPSVSVETGPLVLYEALQLGVPVWGSDRVGQLALLRERGKVVAPNAARTWQAALEEAFAEHARGQWRRPDSRGVRSMGDVAKDMAGAYARVTEPLDAA